MKIRNLFRNLFQPYKKYNVNNDKPYVVNGNFKIPLQNDFREQRVNFKGFAIPTEGGFYQQDGYSIPIDTITPKAPAENIEVVSGNAVKPNIQESSTDTVEMEINPLVDQGKLTQIGNLKGEKAYTDLVSDVAATMKKNDYQLFRSQSKLNQQASEFVDAFKDMQIDDFNQRILNSYRDEIKGPSSIDTIKKYISNENATENKEEPTYSSDGYDLGEIESDSEEGIYDLGEPDDVKEKSSFEIENYDLPSPGNQANYQALLDSNSNQSASDNTQKLEDKAPKEEKDNGVEKKVERDDSPKPS